jgi:hypothetical protein
MHDQAKELQKNITDLEKQIGDQSLCDKIRNATETPLPEGVRLGGKLLYPYHTQTLNPLL